MMIRRPIKTEALRYPLTWELKYKRSLKKLVRALKASIKERLVPLYAQLVAGATPIHFDAAADDWATQINETLAKVMDDMANPIRITEAEMKSVGLGTNNFNKREWQRLVRSAYGVKPFNENEDAYKSKMTLWADRNARLITNIPEKAIGQIKRDTMAALTNGTTVDDLQDIVMKRIDVSDSRAELIARDQVAKLNGDLTSERQKDAGVNQFVWRTVGDERVRDSHDDCDGEVFDWDGTVSLTGVPKPDGNNPGKDFQCRCWSEPIFPAFMKLEAELIAA